MGRTRNGDGSSRLVGQIGPSPEWEPIGAHDDPTHRCFRSPRTSRPVCSPSTPVKWLPPSGERPWAQERRLRTGASFAAFSTSQVNISFLCGLPYVHLADQRPAPVELLAAPVLDGTRYGANPIYFSDVIVRRAGPFQSFADLRGCVWAYNDRDSHSGYNVVRYHLVPVG